MSNILKSSWKILTLYSNVVTLLLESLSFCLVVTELSVFCFVLFFFFLVLGMEPPPQVCYHWVLDTHSNSQLITMQCENRFVRCSSCRLQQSQRPGCHTNSSAAPAWCPCEQTGFFPNNRTSHPRHSQLTCVSLSSARWLFELTDQEGLELEL